MFLARAGKYIHVIYRRLDLLHTLPPLSFSHTHALSLPPLPPPPSPSPSLLTAM
jgi:hypothetical protein